MSIKQQKGYYFSITPKHIYITGVFLFISIIIAYSSIKFIPFVFAPKILLITPIGESIIVDSPDLIVEGEVKNISLLTLNGQKIYIKENNAFLESAVLEDGVNTISLEGKSIFGRKTEVVRSVVYIKN